MIDNPYDLVCVLKRPMKWAYHGVMVGKDKLVGYECQACEIVHVDTDSRVQEERPWKNTSV